MYIVDINNDSQNSAETRNNQQWLSSYIVYEK